MASFLDRIGGAIGGVSIPKGQELTPDQRQQITSAYMNAAQALLAASDNPRTSFGGALGQGLAGAAQGVQKTMKAQRDAEIARQQTIADQMQMRVNQLALDKAEAVSRARKTAPKFSDYNDYPAWSAASAEHYFDNELPTEAAKFLQMYKPQSREERAKFILDQGGKWSKKSDKLLEAQEKYKGIANLLASGSGGQAYSAMIMVLKALDDSVVRDSERASFEKSFGTVAGLEAKYKGALEGQITDRVGAEILTIAAGALSIAEKAYARAAAQKRGTLQELYQDDERLPFLIVPEFKQINPQPVTVDEFAEMRKARNKRKYRD